ncbi:TPA: formylglycine-generating enzyme family protein, partial [Candidatus Poribacteria bacterium]|nr:formylglycine-generating enzyme family protein [Candidatus Poribacteria bacterium]
MIEPSIVIDQIDYPLMTVAKGAFLMGTISGTNNAKSEEEEPQRKVTLPSYLMGQYPITNIQYHQFVDDTNCQTPAYVDDSRFNQPHFPVTGISWLETENFLNWLNQLTKGTYRLPTEAEWEKA